MKRISPERLKEPGRLGGTKGRLIVGTILLVCACVAFFVLKNLMGQFGHDQEGNPRAVIISLLLTGGFALVGGSFIFWGLLSFAFGRRD